MTRSPTEAELMELEHSLNKLTLDTDEVIDNIATSLASPIDDVDEIRESMPKSEVEAGIEKVVEMMKGVEYDYWEPLDSDGDTVLFVSVVDRGLWFDPVRDVLNSENDDTLPNDLGEEIVFQTWSAIRSQLAPQHRRTLDGRADFAVSVSVGADQIGSLIADQTVLSNQEAQVEARIQEGMSAGEIAGDMDISESTVRTVKERIRRKVANAKRTMELVETGA